MFRSASHPSSSSPSQLPKPALQVGEQRPPEHDVEPLGLVHPFPQLPQWLVLVFVSVSQPLFAAPSQSSHGGWLQVGSHAPFVHIVGPWALVQALVQLPHLVTSVLMLVSHPLPVIMSQSAKPRSQPIWHVPPTQLSLPVGLSQSELHMPQCGRLVKMLVSQPLSRSPSHVSKPAEQLGWQKPPAQPVVPLAFVH